MMMRVYDFDPDTVRTVYDFLAHENETEIRLIDPHRRRRPRCVFVRDRSQFLRMCERYNGLYNVYAGLNERRLGGRKREDVLCVKSIVIDLDAVRPDKSQPATKEELGQVYMKAEAIARASKLFGFQHPNVCMSGNGYQLWYAIPSIPITDDNRDEVEERIKQFNRLIKGRYESEAVSIDNVGDLPRIIKVMGTLSIKGEDTEERPHRLSYCVTRLRRREDPYLRQYILSLEPETKGVVCSREAYTPPNFDHLLDKDPKLRSLFNGDVSNYPSRSEAEMALMVKLVFYGFGPDQIWELMDSAQIGKWQQSPEAYRQRSYRKALEYAFRS
jgi:hypothetical protein